MKKAGISYSVNLPVMTAPEQTLKVNRRLADSREALLEQGILTFGGMHPFFGTREEKRKELLFLKEHGIKGIKLHPAYQGADLNALPNLEILDLCAEMELIVVTHAGIDVGVPDRNYASVSMILDVLKQIGPFSFVLAHMGGWIGWEEVKRDLCGAPVWFDTAFSLGEIRKCPDDPAEMIYRENMKEEQFTELVRAHGADRILFGTDCPWCDQKDYAGAIRQLPLTPEEQTLIMGENARTLLQL